jgi:enamine deaminase RidA (YjgF/YER057c/UK114 family)
MSDATVRRVPGARIGYSVVDAGGVGHVFAAAVPVGGGGQMGQTWSALESVAEVMSAESAEVVHQVVFAADSAAAAGCRHVVREFYGGTLPATSYVPQSPCGGQRVAVEAWGLRPGKRRLDIQRINEQLVVAKAGGLGWVFADHAVPRTSAAGVYEKTICSYQHLRRLLPEAGARLGQVLRTWLYLGGIVDDDGPTQRYKELNRARAAVYDGVPFLTEHLPDEFPGPVFPASTGIGATGRSITISALALLSDDDDVLTVPLENPRQTAAYQYAKSYSPTRPRFSRGLTLIHGRDATLFISGTASITHSESQHAGDAVGQTHETLNNIASLISEENLGRHGLPGLGASLDGLAVARVYVKQSGDYDAVRAVCEERLGDVPVTYVVADVCRPELLVEIEGIAFSRLPPTASPALPRRRCRSHSHRVLDRNDEIAPICPAGCPERLSCPNAVLK